jgi:hypothetical protein
MPSKIVVSSRANREIYAAVSYWTQKSNKHALNILKEVEAKSNFIQENPLAYPIFYKDFRRTVILDDFSLIYKIFPDEILIAAFWDNRRNPKTLNL